MTEEKFNIIGMTCSACQSHITRAVEKVNGVDYVNVNLLQNTMVVKFDNNLTNTAQIQNAVKKAGYEAILQTQNDNENLNNKNFKNFNKNNYDKNELFNNLKKLVVCIVLLLVLVYFSMGNMMWGFYSPPCFDYKQNPMGFALIQFLILIPIVFLNRRYFESGFKKLLKGKPNMDTLICIGATVSIIYGIFSMFMISFAQSKLSNINSTLNIEYYYSVIENYRKSLNFESAGMILVFVSIGKFLENLSKNQTKKAIEKLTEMKPTTAVLLIDGNEKTVKIEEVKVGDIVVVRRGDLIPIDGEIVNGTALINESSITGEPVPVQKSKGDMVYSSGIVESGYIEIKSLKVGEDTSFSKVMKLVEEASNSKAPISKLADKISGVFVPIILVISLITFIVNLIISHSFELSLNFAVTVIVIACPCALGLATPVSIMVGTGKGAENGLLIKNAEIMEKAHLIKTIVFDKTGTITEGKPTVVRFEKIKEIDDMMSIIYSIENKSEHPLAKSIIEFAKMNNAKELEILNFNVLEGFGLSAELNQKKYYIGNLNFAKSLNVDCEKIEEKIEKSLKNAEIPLIFIENNDIIAIFFIKDEIKKNSKQAIELLKKFGIKTIMLTGDNSKTAEIISKAVGVDEFISEVKPDEKQDVIKSLKSDKKHLVAMVGDGVNDAPALSSADLAISVGSGSEIALESSDIVLLKNDLLDILNVINLSRRVLKTIKLGLFWAFFYNFICVLISTGLFYYPFGFKINPMIGSIAMSLSSVSVVLNALTINLFKPIKLNKKETSECKSSCEINKNLADKEELKDNENKLKDNFNELNGKENNIINEKMENIIMEFYVREMMCRHCENNIRKAFNEAGDEVLEVNLETKKVVVKTQKSFEEVEKIVKNAGYEASLE